MAPKAPGSKYSWDELPFAVTMTLLDFGVRGTVTAMETPTSLITVTGRPFELFHF